MITINLLPQHLRPIKRTPLPYLLSGLMFVLVAAGLSLVFVQKQFAIMSAQQRSDELQADLDDLQAVIDESNELTAKKILLNDKKETIAEITQDRMVWSKELWNISRLTPPNVWYKEIKQSTKRIMRMERVLNKQTNLMETKQVPIEQPILSVSGYVVTGEEGQRAIAPLTAAVATDPDFTQNFRLDPPAFGEDEFEGFVVKTFTFEFVIEKKQDMSVVSGPAPTPLTVPGNAP